MMCVCVCVYLLAFVWLVFFFRLTISASGMTKMNWHGKNSTSTHTPKRKIMSTTGVHNIGMCYFKNVPNRTTLYDTASNASWKEWKKKHQQQMFAAYKYISIPLIFMFIDVHHFRDRERERESLSHFVSSFFYSFVPNSPKLFRLKTVLSRCKCLYTTPRVQFAYCCNQSHWHSINVFNKQHISLKMWAHTSIFFRIYFYYFYKILSGSLSFAESMVDLCFSLASSPEPNWHIKHIHSILLYACVCELTLDEHDDDDDDVQNMLQI